MSHYSTIDRESFQTFLASAFTVQQSQMDRQSLSAIVKVAMKAKSGSLHQDEAARPTGDATRSLADSIESSGDSLGENQIPLPELEEEDRSSGVFLAHLASTMSVHGTEAASADLALDLALNDIAEQARLETNAGAAVIALQCGEEMVCRAYAGKRALELGEFLQGAGLFDDWAHARKVQCCTDTEADVRVDVAACHRLGVRSFLILPVLKQEELVGLFGISSSSPEAFAHREIGILEALSRQVLIHVDCAAEFSTLPPKEEPSIFADSMGPTSATFPIGQPELKSSQFQV